MAILPSRCRCDNPLFRVLIVEPVGEFTPTNWRQAPSNYRVLRVAVEPTKSLGTVDAFRFLHNKRHGPSTWAIREQLSPACVEESSRPAFAI